MIGLSGEMKHRVDILKDINGRIAPFKLTLLLGPPGSGRSGMCHDATFVHIAHLLLAHN